MGFELDAFLGKVSELREWKREFPSVVVCRLSGDLGLAPVTDEFFQELSKWYPHPAYPSTGCLDAARSWGAHASRNTTIAFVSAFEFGDDGSEEAILWSNGKVIPSGGSLTAIIHYFRDQAGFHIEEKVIDIEKYRGETAAEKWAAAAILDELVERSEKPIAGLIEALSYERKSKTIQIIVRGYAANSLAKLGPAARAAIPYLEQRLKSDQDYGICIAAASALAAIGPEAAPALASSLSDATYKKKWPIIHALGKLGPAARQAIPELVKVLQDQVLHETIGDRTEAARSLGEIGAGAREAVPALIEALKDQDWSLRSAAAEALGNICPAARDVASALNDAQNDDNQWVRKAASQALAKIQDLASRSQIGAQSIPRCGSD